MTAGAGERFAVLGLASPRAPWLRDVARWSTAAALPLDLVRCLSTEEVRARLASGRRWSALVADGSLPDLDRDLLDAAAGAGCAVFVVSARDEPWLSLGADAVLPPELARDRLAGALDQHAARIGSVTDAAPSGAAGDDTGRWRGRLVAVTGAGGTGASTVAMALAQGSGPDPRWHGRVLLADLALDADQALRHRSSDVLPGLSELVEACRLAVPDTAAVLAHTFSGPAHPYGLLLGLRRHRDWSALRPRALEIALTALRRDFALVVADVDPDVEGERSCGSIDVEERNALARTATATADLVAVTFRPDDTGVRRLVQLVAALADHGVDRARIVPVANRAGRSPARRAALASAVAELTRDPRDPTPLGPTVFVGEQRHLARAELDGAPLPAAVAAAVTGPIRAILDRLPPAGPADPEPVAVGTLGTFTEASG